MELLIQPGKLTLADLRKAYLNPIKVKLDDSASDAINASVACVEKIVNEGRTAYGINTGFGLLASTKIAPEDLEKLYAFEVSPKSLLVVCPPTPNSAVLVLPMIITPLLISRSTNRVFFKGK